MSKTMYIESATIFVLDVGHHLREPGLLYLDEDLAVRDLAIYLSI